MVSTWGFKMKYEERERRAGPRAISRSGAVVLMYNRSPKSKKQKIKFFKFLKKILISECWNRVSECSKRFFDPKNARYLKQGATVIAPPKFLGRAWTPQFLKIPSIGIAIPSVGTRISAVRTSRELTKCAFESANEAPQHPNNRGTRFATTNHQF